MMETIGRFNLVGELGAGAFGSVYEGVDPLTGSSVAVKLLDRTGPPSDAARQQLRAEASALLAVRSPHTLVVVDVVDEGGRLALVTDLVPGVSLRALLDESGPLSGPAALTVLHGAASGLAAVHAAGLVHGDVKPANILVPPDGESKLIDFGLAALPGWVAEDSASPWGSPAYTPPEHVAHEYRDHRSDIYALTVTLFELLCGERPFVGETIEQVRTNHVHQEIPDPRLWVPDLGDGLTQLVLWGLAKDPADRPHDVATWLAHLEAAAEERYGSGWYTPASVGAVVGGLAAGGLLASGVLTAAPTATTVAGAGAVSTAASAGSTGFLTTALGKTAVAALTAVAVCGGAIGAKAVWDETRSVVPPAPASEQAPPELPKEPRVAYTGCDESRRECGLFVVDPDDPDAAERIAAFDLPQVGGDFDEFPVVWSPTGTHVAYSIPADEGSVSTFVAPVDGSGGAVDLGSGTMPSFSPDGERVAFAEWSEGSTEVWSMALDGSDRRREDVPAGTTSVDWSADGETLLPFAFDSGGCEGSQFSLPAVGGAGDSVDVEGVLQPPLFAVDTGAAVMMTLPEPGACRDDAGAEVDLTVVDTDGEPRVVGQVEPYSDLSLSPDGSTVAVSLPRDPSYEFAMTLIDSASGSREVLPEAGSYVEWFPEGDRIAYRPNTDTTGVGVMALDGSRKAQIAEGLVFGFAVGAVSVAEGEPSAPEESDSEWTEAREFDPPIELARGDSTLSDEVEGMPGDPSSFVAEENLPGDSPLVSCADLTVRISEFHPSGFARGGVSGCTVGVGLLWKLGGGTWTPVLEINGRPICSDWEEVGAPLDWYADDCGVEGE